MHKKKFTIKDFSSKCDQIRSFLRIWSHLLEKSLMKNFIFCAAKVRDFPYCLLFARWSYKILTTWLSNPNATDLVVNKFPRRQSKTLDKSFKKQPPEMFYIYLRSTNFRGYLFSRAKKIYISWVLIFANWRNFDFSRVLIFFSRKYTVFLSTFQNVFFYFQDIKLTLKKT